MLYSKYVGELVWWDVVGFGLFSETVCYVVAGGNKKQKHSLFIPKKFPFCVQWTLIFIKE